MESAEILVEELRRLAVQTGHLSESCLGCGFEHNCSVHGCQVLQQAADMIEELNRFHGSSLERLLAQYDSVETLLRESEAARTELAWRLVSAERQLHERKSESKPGSCMK